MTIDSCQKSCNLTTNPYFGVARGTECFCGKKIHHMKNDLHYCHRRCPGNPTQICGGKDLMIVYEQPAALVKTSIVKLEGCFFVAEQPDNRYIRSSSESMTIDRCYEDCIDLVYRERPTYFGVENRTRCICQFTVMSTNNVYLKYCDNKCPGDPKQICGGPRLAVVYEHPK
uniref:WSC domain-containing protein n=1 Tax=Macrostomum lignano TaxID=282301 RepID=A0A1I8H2M3_9PLAT